MEKLYNKLKEENLRIMKKSNNYTIDKDINALDILMFKITSLTMSLIINYDKSIYIGITERFLLRTLLEELALYYYILDGGEFNSNVFKHSIYQFEYPIYKDLKDSKLANLEVMRANYLKSRDVIKEDLNIGTKNFKKMFDRRMPFIDGVKNYNELVELKLGNFTAKMYSRLSSSTHFSINTKDKLIHEESKITRKFVIDLVNDIIDDNNYTYFSNYYEHKNRESKLDECYKAEKKLVYKIMFHLQKDESLVNNIIQEYYYSLDNIHQDYKFNLIEVMNIKIKPLFELLASLDLYLNKRDELYSDQLIKYNNEFKFKTKELKEDLVNDYYNLYLEESKKDITKDEFILNLDNQFIIIKDEELHSYNKIVDYFIENNQDINNKTFNKLKVIDDPINNLRMMYDESMLISHANGSLFFVNKSVYSDDSIMTLYPYLLINILSKYSRKNKDIILGEFLTEYEMLALYKMSIINEKPEIKKLIEIAIGL